MELVDTKLVQSPKLSAWATWGPPWGLDGYLVIRCLELEGKLFKKVMNNLRKSLCGCTIFPCELRNNYA